MITARDLRFATAGAATAGLALGSGPGVAGGFLLGAAATGLLAWRSLRTVNVEREGAELAARDLGLNLLAAWLEADRLRAQLGQAPVDRPAIADLTRPTRQEDECSSAAS